MAILIRPMQDIGEYRAAEQVQRIVWQIEDARIVPDALMLTAHKNGGLALGAFDTAAPAGPQMIGFLFGMLGLHPDGRVKHCSHQMGVLPTYQNQQIGYRLKQAQRDYVLAQGLDLITWTFDPLESRNAYLNLHRLGAVCHTYLRNIYGDMRDQLNQGLPSDRFEVAWHIGSRHVADRLANLGASSTLADLRAAGVPLLAAGPQHAPPLDLIGQHARLLLPVPADFQAVKTTAMDAALHWRQQTRQLFEAAFAAGYTATDMVQAEGMPCYLLERNWHLS